MARAQTRVEDVVLGVVAGGLALWASRRVRFSLEGRVALVTGGSRGLGLEISRELLRRGAKVAICARDENELERARQQLARGGEVVALRCDLADRSQVENLAREVSRRLGPIDVLVNNAGVIQVGPAEEMTLEDFDEAMHAHFYGPLWLTWAVLPQMRRRREGRIVNISSIGGKIAVPHLLPYDASKFALTGLSEGLRAELAKDGIRVTTVCPGLMRTGSPQNAYFKGRHRAEYALFKNTGSMPGLTMSSPRAARKIVDALVEGRAELILTKVARLGARLHGLFPGAVTNLLGIADRLLPGEGGIGQQRAKGRDSESRWSHTPVTALSDRAARRNNEGLF